MNHNPLDPAYKKTILDNGIRVITENIPHVRSIAIGFWFDTGSRDEPAELAGSAHFLEHMNFKGTSSRSAVKIASEIEGRGGHMNAFTGKETTTYLARVIDEHTRNAVDVLADITHNSIFDEKEIDREKTVILEELKNMEDSAEEMVFEHFISDLFFPHSLGRCILGTREAIKKMTREDLKDYARQAYTGERLVFCAAGNLNHDRLVKMIERRWKNDYNQEQIRIPPPPVKPEKYVKKIHTPTTQQAHILWGCRGLTYSDKNKYTLFIINTILGSGMSSRLFQKIRETHGLAYTVYSFLETFIDSGIFGIYAGAAVENTDNVIELIEKEIQTLIRKPVSKRNLQRTKDQIKGNLLLGLESPSSRMQRLAKMEIYTGKMVLIDEVISYIDQVTTEDIQELASKLFAEQAVYQTTLLPH